MNVLAHADAGLVPQQPFAAPTREDAFDMMLKAFADATPCAGVVLATPHGRTLRHDLPDDASAAAAVSAALPLVPPKGRSAFVDGPEGSTLVVVLDEDPFTGRAY